MALVYICPTCGKKYEASVNGNGVVYLDENRRITLESEDKDCSNCLELINQAVVAKREEIKIKTQV
jgi:hypothetical protein